MKKPLLIAATIILFAECSDKNKSITPQSTKQNAIDSLEYTVGQQRKIDSLEELGHDSLILKTFEGPAMTPLGDAPKKQGSGKNHKKHSTAS